MVSNFTCRFGFVTFDDVKTAERMMDKYNGIDLDGFQITLQFAEERRGGGGGGGGERSDWGCGRDRGQYARLSVNVVYPCVE